MQNIVIGGLILWLSWFFFNGSAGYKITSMSYDASKIPAKNMMNTLLSGSVSALVVLFFKPIIMRKVSPASNFNPANIIDGLLSGHVAITAACNNVSP
jgi:ammonia channel protein AmtB